MAKHLLLLALLVFLIAPTVYGESVSKRSQALQFYQEGLFQETGTGDLKMASSIYETILKDYREFRDIQAVALYHLGLIHIKLGKNESALAYFNKIKKQYNDQKTVHKQAVIKAKHLKTLILSSPQSSTLNHVNHMEPKPIKQHRLSKKPSEKNLLFRTSQIGIGINNIGLHLRLPLTNLLHFEPRLQVQPWDQRFLASIRGLYYLQGPKSTSRNLPYFGLEGGTLSNQSGKWDYKIGSFMGYEWTVSNTFSLNGDFGYYYQNNPDGQNITVQTLLLLNLGATFYF